MEPISTNISSMVPMNQNAPSISFHPSNFGMQNQKFVNDIAAFVPGLSTSGTNFDMLMNNIASFKDIISVAQNGLSQMRGQGESIRDLIAQAREEGVTPELMDKIQEEVNSRLGEIRRIRDGADFNGINPFNGSFSLDIPNVLEGFSIGGSAKIEIGYTEDGALQINVDASMDFDLSGIVNNGVSSDEAWNLINEFLDMLGVQEGDLGNAQNLMDVLFEKLFNLMTGNGESGNEVEMEMDSSSELKGHIVQQASITLDGFAGQPPSIAINIL